jgi:hypothetical protein
VWLNLAFRGHSMQILQNRVLRGEIALYLEVGQKGVFTLAVIAFVARVSTLLQFKE